MFFVGNKTAKVNRDGLQVTLATGEPIPEAKNFPNLLRLVRMGRITCDYRDGENVRQFGVPRTKRRVMANPYKAREELEALGYSFHGVEDLKSKDIFDIYAVEILGDDRILPEWFEGLKKEADAAAEADLAPAPPPKAEISAPAESDDSKALKKDLQEIGFNIPDDAKPEHLSIVMDVISGVDVDKRKIPKWAKEQLADFGDAE